MLKNVMESCSAVREEEEDRLRQHIENLTARLKVMKQSSRVSV